MAGLTFKAIFKARFRACSGAGPVHLLHVSLAVHWTSHDCLITHVLALFMYITILSTAALHQTCRGRHVRVDRILPNSDEKQRTTKSRKLKGQSKNSSLEGIRRISLFRDDVGGKCNYLSIRDTTELVEKVMEEQRQVLTCWLVDWWDLLQC